MSRPSLAGRLLASSLLGLALVLPLGGAALSFAFRRSAEAAFDARLDAWFQAVLAALAADRSGRPAPERALPDPRFEQPLSGWYWEARSGGERVAASRSLWDAELAAPSAPDGQTGVARLEGPRSRTLRALTRTVTLPGVQEPFVLTVAGDEGELRREIARFDALLLAALAALGAGVLALGAVQMRVALRPLRALERELTEVRAGSRERLGGEAPRELASLADSLNALLAHDAALVRRARELSADLAHALKTPLSVIRAEGEELGGERGARIVAQADAMRRHLERRLARAPRPAVAGGRTPVAPVLGAIADTLRRLHPARALELDVPEELAFRGAREDLEEIAGNLLENACKWARRRVRASAREADGRLVLRIEDDGPGLAPEARERALARGGRLDERAPGSGLGLAIVREVVDAHGGALRLGASDLGGLRAEVELPAVVPPA